MPSNLLVCPYTIETLKQLLVGPESSAHVVESKSHTVYFQGYFGTIGAKTIVVEDQYVDRDFLEDYAAYYVRCFHQYRRECRRLHFFQEAFDQAALDALLGGETGPLTDKSLKQSYLGFVVAKPLPETIIGRTCLKTYEPDGGRRNFPIVRSYEANLCGISLQVETLAFQEQDRVAAACATSALWSVFQGTGKLFQHHIPSPVEITQAAREHWVSQTRLLPNRGLTAEQMAYAVRKVGLEPLLLSATDDFLRQATVYAYLQGRVPLLLLVRLDDHSSGSAEEMGRHAIAVTGYSLGATTAQPHHSGFLLKAQRIDKLYAHDDQIGPFARMEIRPGYLNTAWKGKDGKTGSVRATPEVLIVPLYHKIRIPLQAVLDVVIPFDAILEMLRPIIPSILPQRPEWDIRLTTINEFKGEVKDNPDMQPEYKRRILKSSLPRFIWRATAQAGTFILLDLLFDATDIEQGHFLSTVVEHSAGFGAFLHGVSNDPVLTQALTGRPPWRILEWFAQLQQGASSVSGGSLVTGTPLP